MWIEQILESFSQFPELISFFGSVIGGESVIIFLSALAAQEVFPIWKVILFGFLGTVFSDSIWYLIPKTKLFAKFISWRYVKNNYSKVINGLDKITKGNDGLFFFISKFLYGTRIITIFYISNKNFGYLRFLKYDASVTAIWLGVMVGVGYLGGESLSRVENVLENTQLGLTLIFLFVVLFYALNKSLDKYLLKRVENEG